MVLDWFLFICFFGGFVWFCKLFWFWIGFFLFVFLGVLYGFVNCFGFGLVSFYLFFFGFVWFCKLFWFWIGFFLFVFLGVLYGFVNCFGFGLVSFYLFFWGFCMVL